MFQRVSVKYRQSFLCVVTAVFCVKAKLMLFSVTFQSHQQ